MTKKISLLGVLTLLSIMVWGQNFPFPQNVEYPYGIVASDPKTATIQSKFQAWDQSFYAESGNYARIKFDEPDQTVSEGIGYGMLIYVYMANNSNSLNQDKFDKLWNYYQNWSNYNGYIMDWKINAFSNSMEQGKSATDGDLDVAYAMLLAHKQWGSSGAINYIQEAEGLLNAIFNYQVNSQLLLKPGHHWDNAKNPCYFTLASINMFAEAQSQEGFSQTKNWDGVYSKSIEYLENTQSNGLWADWTFDGVDPSNNCDMGCDFYWDACRTPWRVAHDYVWNGTAASKTMCDNTIAFLNAKNLLSSPANAGGYSNLTAGSAAQVTALGGDTQGNSCFVGGLGAALMVDETKQANLDSYYNYMINRTENPDWGYYAPTIQILYLLTMSGNAPDFYQMNSGPTPPRISGAETNAEGTQLILSVNKDVMTPASSETGSFVFKINTITQTSPFSAISLDGTSTIVLDLATSVSIEPGDIMTISYTPGTILSTEGIAMESFSNQAVTNRLAGNSTLVDDCEDMDNLNELGGAWYTYVDADNEGTSTIDPLTSETVDFTMTEGGANGSAYSAEVAYTLGGTWGTDDNDPFVGIGTQLGADETPMDISVATGISFYHKGDACVLEIYIPENLGASANYDTYSVPVSAHADWTKVELAWTDFSQAGWGDVYDLDLTEVYKFQWKISDAPATAGTVALDYVVLEGLAGGSTPTVDKSGLVTAISTAEDNIAIAVAGTEPGNYPQTAIDDLQTALDAAQLVAADSEADQAAVDQAETDLLAAIDVFNAAQIEPSSTLIASNELASTELLTYWFTYTDVDNSGLSTVTPANGEQFESVTPGADGTDSAAQITYTLDKGENANSPFVGFGFNTKEVETESFDFSGTDGISFYHKGDACALEVSVPENMGATPNYDTYHVSIPAHTTWTQVEYAWTDFVQYGWGDVYTFDISQIYKFQWKVEGATGDAGTVALDQVAIVGGSITLPTIPESVDKSALTTKITETQTIIDAAVIGTDPGEYPQSAGMALENAKAAAQYVADDDAATQAEVDQAVIDLQDAIDTFEASVISEPNVDVAALEAKITEATNTLLTADIGTAEGQHPQSAADELQIAIDDAQALVDNPTTQVDVDAMVATLDDAITIFVNTTNPSVGVDKDALQSIISSAESTYSNAVEGSADGEYEVGAKADLQTAIDAAELVFNDATATQAEVDQAVSDMETALNVFQSRLIGVNKSSLQSLVSSAQSLLSAATAGTTAGTYPQTSIDDFEYAINNAQIILINSGYTQASVDQAVVDLQDAIDVFEASVNPVTVSKDELETVIAQARAIYESAVVGSEPGEYPFQETHVFISEIESAEELYEDDAAIQAQVNQMVSDLQDAIATFEAAQVPGDPATDINSVVSVDLAVYPNPCSSFVSVNSSELISRVSVVSINGTVVKELDANDTNVIIDVNDLSQGVYFIHLEFDSVQQESIQIFKK